MNFPYSALTAYRSHAVKLLSMDLLDPLRDIMVGDAVYSNHLKEFLRFKGEGAVFEHASMEVDEIILGSAFGGIPLAQFIDVWYWHQDRYLMGIINEMSGVFFPVGSVADDLDDFIQSSLNISSVSEVLSDLRNSEHDRQVLDAVRKCEASFLVRDPSDWDAELVNAGMFPDPALDVTFPIYKGYLDFTAIRSIQSLLRRYFDNKNQLMMWLTSLERKIGPLSFKDKWEL